jgi:hypothetical protein
MGLFYQLVLLCHLYQAQQQQPLFGAPLNFPRSNNGNAGPNLVHQRSGPIDVGLNYGNQGSNLVYSFQNAVHAGSNLAQQRANLGSQQVHMHSENFVDLPH